MKRILGALLVLSLVLSLGAVTAFAVDPTVGTESRYEGNEGNLSYVDGTAFEFDKYLVLNKNADIPNVRFRFVIEPATDGDPLGEQVYIAPKDKDDIATVDPKSAKDYNVIGKPKFSAAADQSVSAAGDELILTYKPGDGYTLESAAPSTKTIQFMTKDADPTMPITWKSTDEKYVQKTMTIDFSGVTFLEPGVYRYVITEDKSYTKTNTPLPGMVYDPEAANPCVRYLDVYVTEKKGSDPADISGALQLGDGGAVVTGYVLHENSNAPKIGDDKGTDEGMGSYFNPGIVNPASTTELADKSTGFSNQYATKSLEFKKQVKGNQGSRDKYFQFRVTVTFEESEAPALYPTALYEVDMSNASYTPSENVATKYSLSDLTNANHNELTLNSATGKLYVTGQQLMDGKIFYLQHGQTIRIKNLPAKAEYTVFEVDAENYKQVERGAVDATGTTNYANKLTGVLETEDCFQRTDGVTAEPDDPGPDDVVYTSYLNERSGVIPTGVLTVIGPAVAVILLGMIGLGAVLVGKRRRAEDAE